MKVRSSIVAICLLLSAIATFAQTDRGLDYGYRFRYERGRRARRDC